MFAFALRKAGTGSDGADAGLTQVVRTLLERKPIVPGLIGGRYFATSFQDEPGGHIH